MDALLVAVTLGSAFTTSVLVKLPVQPAVFVPTTEYVAVNAGLTETEALVAPVVQLYVVAPPAVKVAVWPEQIADGPVMAITGNALTVTVVRAVPVQPCVLVPDTE